MSEKTITIARQNPNNNETRSKKVNKNTSVYPEEGAPPMVFDHSHEKSFGIPVDIEEGRVDPVSALQNQDPSQRRHWWNNKLILLMAIAILVVGVTLTGIVVGLQDDDDEVQVENIDSAIAKSELFDEVLPASTNVSEVAVGNVPPPCNDECEAAVFFPFVDLPRMINGTTLGATPDFDSSAWSFVAKNCGETSDAYGVWYTFLGNGKTTHISYSNSWGEQSQMSIFSGSCHGLICEDFGGSDLAEVVLELDKWYWLLLAGKTKAAVGDFGLSISQEEDGTNTSSTATAVSNPSETSLSLTEPTSSSAPLVSYREWYSCSYRI